MLKHLLCHFWLEKSKIFAHFSAICSQIFKNKARISNNRISDFQKVEKITKIGRKWKKWTLKTNEISYNLKNWGETDPNSFLEQFFLIF